MLDSAGEAAWEDDQLLVAILCKDAKMMKRVLREGNANGNPWDLDCPPVARGSTYLHHAINVGDTGIAGVKLLVEQGANVNAQDWDFLTPAAMAARAGYHKVLEYLITVGKCDVHILGRYDFTALTGAAMEGHTSCVRLLIAAKADMNCVNSSGFSPLLCAALNGHGEVAAVLIEYGAMMELREEEQGNTALNLAAGHGHLRVVQALVRKSLPIKANIETVNNEGNTPLLSAAKNGKLDCVRALLRAGCLLETMDKYGNTALILLSRFFNGNGVRVMLMWGANINHRNNALTNAIMTVAKRKDWSTVDLLIAGGAIVSFVNKKGKSVLTHLLQASDDALIRRKLAFMVVCCVNADPVELVEADVVSLFNAVSAALNHYKEVMEFVTTSFSLVRDALLAAGIEDEGKSSGATDVLECVVGYLGMTRHAGHLNAVLDKKNGLAASHIVNDRRAFEFWFYKHHVHERSWAAEEPSAAPTQIAPREPPTKRCDNEGCCEPGDKRCSRCKTVSYCSPECQRAGWKKHKTACKSIFNQ